MPSYEETMVSIVPCYIWMLIIVTNWAFVYSVEYIYSIICGTCPMLYNIMLHGLLWKCTQYTHALKHSFIVFACNYWIYTSYREYIQRFAVLIRPSPHISLSNLLQCCTSVWQGNGDPVHSPVTRDRDNRCHGYQCVVTNCFYPDTMPHWYTCFHVLLQIDIIELSLKSGKGRQRYCIHSSVCGRRWQFSC